MPRLISLSSALFVTILALPAVSSAQTTIAPEDEKRAEGNVFLNAKVIAIDRDRDRIEVRDNDGVRRTFVLDEDATLPTGRVKAGTEVILAVKETGHTRRVISVQPSERAPAARVPVSRNQPVYVPAPSRPLTAAEQMAFSSGTVGVGANTAPSAPRPLGPYLPGGVGFIDPNTGLVATVPSTRVGTYGTPLQTGRTFTNADLVAVSRTTSGTIVLTGPASTQMGHSGLTATVDTTPPSPDLAAVDPDPLSVGRAVQAFEVSISRLAMKAEEVDSAFGLYRETCLGLTNLASGQPTRSWMGIWNGQSAPPDAKDQCEPKLSFAVRVGQQVQRGIRAAEAQAGRAGVLPGVRRQIRAAYGMDWEGWDH